MAYITIISETLWSIIPWFWHISIYFVETCSSLNCPQPENNIFSEYREVRFNLCVRWQFLAIFFQTCTKNFANVVWLWFEVRSIDIIANYFPSTHGMFIRPLKIFLRTHEPNVFAIFMTHTILLVPANSL